MTSDIFAVTLAYAFVFGGIALYALFLGRRAQRLRREIEELRGSK